MTIIWSGLGTGRLLPTIANELQPRCKELFCGFSLVSLTSAEGVKQSHMQGLVLCALVQLLACPVQAINGLSQIGEAPTLNSDLDNLSALLL